ncbi:LOW QUALITY PROTEIN: hypothetical protein QTO34_017081 [Cnephaeus nilssonii]|uniref:Uncharacterized protein n=1 Tax=Cnephaeus nilssonii TaxID=3371016 RepID=A0AA40I0G0_CNENI|nr:LOW QUALITY PROTEIN: hypothetical protein QTO34_017081 [Eptesicus nilssonii]
MATSAAGPVLIVGSGARGERGGAADGAHRANAVADAPGGAACRPALQCLCQSFRVGDRKSGCRRSGSPFPFMEEKAEIEQFRDPRPQAVRGRGGRAPPAYPGSGPAVPLGGNTGLIGRSWAMLFASGGFRVKLFDVEQRQITNALENICYSAIELVRPGVEMETEPETRVLASRHAPARGGPRSRTGHGQGLGGRPAASAAECRPREETAGRLPRNQRRSLGLRGSGAAPSRSVGEVVRLPPGSCGRKWCGSSGSVGGSVRLLRLLWAKWCGSLPAPVGGSGAAPSRLLWRKWWGSLRLLWQKCAPLPAPAEVCGSLRLLSRGSSVAPGGGVLGPRWLPRKRVSLSEGWTQHNLQTLAGGHDGVLGPRVTLQVGGKPVSFLVDTGAAYSVLTEPMGPYWGNVATELDRSGTRPLRAKEALISAPALALPDFTKPFHLYVSEVRGIAKGVLTQTLGPWKRPVAYLSKRLDPVAAGWPVPPGSATTALLVKEADKQTLGQELALTTPHGVEALLRGAPERWMSNTKITQCQALLLDQPRIRCHKTLAINPASLLPDDDQRNPFVTAQRRSTNGSPRPDRCPAIITRRGTVHGWEQLCSGWHPIGRSSGSTLDRTIWAQSLNRGTTAQKADSAIPQERGPNCQGSRPKTSGPLTLPDLDLRQNPSYTKQEEELAEQRQAIKGPDGWWILPDDRLLVPEALGYPLGVTKTSELLRGSTIPSLDKVIKSIVTRSTVCAQVNAKQGKRVPLGIRAPGKFPGEHWEVDFTEIKPPASGYKYLLVLIDTFSGWVKAYPTRTETASIIVKKLLQEIIPKFRLPVVIGSDNSPAFVAKVFKSIAQA